MKYIALLCLLPLGAQAQDARQILTQTYEKCQSIRNGHYVMTKEMKYMSGQDTVSQTVDCLFKKIENDPNFSSLFHYGQSLRDEYIGEVIYTGEYFVRTSILDSTATVMSVSRWPEEIRQLSYHTTFFSPLTNAQSAPLPQEEDFTDNSQSFAYLGEEMIKGVACHRIRIEEQPEEDPDEMLKTLGVTREFWIRKDEMIPLQFTITFTLLMAADTMYQFERFSLDRYELNTLKDESLFSLNSIPLFYTLKDFVPYQSQPLLPVDTLAPPWSLPSLTDELVSLESLKGQVVLIDFFYKSCYPCLQALPTLQSFHEKYHDKGLRVIGINPFDKKEDGIVAFMAKRGVTYTVVLEGKEVAAVYRVSGYPTLYLIDKHGKVVFAQEGYGKSVEKKMEKVIRKYL